MVSLATGVTNSIAVCVSPLTAIMQEQAQRFTATGGFVGETQKDPIVRQKVLNGDLDLVYISPENLINNSLILMLLSQDYKQRLISLVVDEGHCVKTW